MDRTKKKFWLALVIFSLTGQIAWVVENMYFNVFIYKMFHASATDISLMVGASAITAALTTLFIGSLSDKVGKRKIFICSGYLLWGISILTFAFIRMDILEAITGSVTMAASLGITLVILMDSIMTFFGSSANDAAFNAWVTDMGDSSNRGIIEGINSMMPLVAILVVFGGFMPFNLDQKDSWTVIYFIIGTIVFTIGIVGLFIIKETAKKTEENSHYFRNICYSFRPSVIRKNKLLYSIIGVFAVFGIVIQIFMPYLILYYEQTLKMQNYVLIMAPAIILAAIVTAFYGKLYDLLGFKLAVIPTVFILMSGLLFLFFFTGFVTVFIGSFLMMTGYLTGMAMYGAMIRDHIPEDKAGLFQGVRIIGQVLVPGIIGPAIGALVLSNADEITNNDGTTSFLPNRYIFLVAFLVAVLLLITLLQVFRMMRNGHRKLTSDIAQSGYSEYPRPQLRRTSFFSLNGQWELNHKKIEVPYPPQSDLSGYKKHVGQKLIYEKNFSLPEGFQKDKVLLHFGAVDQKAEVYLNNNLVMIHEGGYLPFYGDVTTNIKAGNNHITVIAYDSLSHTYPYGKQRKDRGGMWYTPVSGIWQSVWMESVPEQYVETIKMTPSLTGIHFAVKGGADKVNISIYDDEAMNVMLASYQGLQKEAEIIIQNPQLWTPENPKLYYTKIESGEDVIYSYFALRTIEIRKAYGHYRILLNEKPYFLHGVLDQGYFCDGIYLPKSEEGYRQDILNMKGLGFNTLRKHIKIEPECYYYACDKYGMLIMQDMVNSGKYSFLWDTAIPTLGRRTKNDLRGGGSRKRKDFFIQHMQETVEHLYNHPSIVYYTIFNEGWGQFESDHMYELLKTEDSTRIIDTTSGWFRRRKSDVVSVHIYFKTPALHKTYRPMVVSECGGYSYVIPDHSYSLYAKFGYGNCADSEQLTGSIQNMYKKMIFPYIKQGLSGCIYTQLSDVEDETNGFYTYDRKICKVDKAHMLEISKELYRLTEELYANN